MRFIAIDLELEQPSSHAQTADSVINEEYIIQAGIVVFELAAQEPTILHSETMFVHYPHPVSKYIKALTSITDEQVNEADTDIQSVVHRLAHLRSLFDTSRQIVEWGGGDVKAIQNQARLTSSAWHSFTGFARSTINAKTLYQCYALANGIKAQGGLSKSMSKLKLQFKCTRYEDQNRGAHWAESDALNTARIFNKLIELMRR